VGDLYPPTVQREALLKLVEALGCWDRALRRDECGDWRINGKLGHIYAVPGTLDDAKREGFQIYCRCAEEFEEPTSSQGWTWAKKVLSFCEVVNDGDDEGMLFLARLPNPEEAAAIRDKIGITKKREISDAERERLAGMGHRFGARRDGVVSEIGGEKPPSAAEADRQEPDGPEKEI
jgi:hypothetical protein